MRKALLLSLALLSGLASAKDFTMTILHTNDLHARVEPTLINKSPYGGYARQATLIKRFMASDPNPILVNAGDVFQGTLYFNIYEGQADLAFMNRFGYTAMTLGNHEFDRGPKILSNFIKGARFPILSCNLDFTAEPALKGLVQPYTIVKVGGQNVGLIGAETPELPELSSPGPNVKMLDLTASLTKCVAELSKKGVNKIILLSHLGYELEQKVAASVSGIDVIVGGHSHTLLGTFTDPNLPKPAGPYPTVIKHSGADQTLIVSSWEWGKVFGRIKVSFNGKGYVSGWSDAGAIPVDSSVPEDPEAVQLVEALSRPVIAFRTSTVATAASPIDGDREGVRRRESPMGNMIADAMMAAGKSAGVELAIENGGSVRTGFGQGKITMENVLEVQPFGGTLVYIDLTGAELLQVFEHGASGWEDGKGMFPHVSRSVKLAFDIRKPIGQRLTSATFNGAPFDTAKTYRVAFNNFTAGGGDGYTMLASKPKVDTGLLDYDVLAAYLRTLGNVSAQPEGRVIVTPPLR